MDKQSFEQRFMKIISTFGAKNYSQDRVSIIYSEVKNLTSDDFSRLVDHLIGSSKMAPLVPDFRRSIAELGLRAQRPRLDVIETTASIVQAENFIYHLQDNAWANNTHIFTRGPSVRECGFVLKEEHPHHPLVKLDEQVRDERLKEIKSHLLKGTLPRFEEDKIGSLRKADFGAIVKGAL